MSLNYDPSPAEQEIIGVETEIAVLKKKLAKLRSKLPTTPVEDYTFESQNGTVRLSELFGDQNELWMVSNMGTSCKYCTLWGDNYNGIHRPLSDRAAFVVASPNDILTQKNFAESRGWKFKMVSHSKNTWAADTGFQDDNMVLPGVAVYVKTDEGIQLHSRSNFGPGDNFCNMWDFIDLLPSGVNGWVPKYEY